MHKFCKCGGSILTLEQMSTDQICDRCKKKQIEDLPKKDKKEEEDD